MKRVWLAVLLILSALGAQASEPLVVGYGNGHLSAIYASKEFDLQLEDGRVLKATKGAKQINLDGRAYKCEVTRYGQSWGNSEMGLECGGSRRSDNIYLRILAERTDDKITGLILFGPDADTVQVELNWLDAPSMVRQPDPSVSKVKFELVRHEGWLVD